MNFLFTPNHVQLLNSCYPPTSALLTAGPDYSPNSQELSRLTYYASNHPGKLSKLGGELEKRLKLECRKAKAGNQRTRASLLITLAIFRALATECRRDIAMLSPSLIASVDAVVTTLSGDLELSARAASVFIAWTTYTNGHLIGADSSVTRDYLSALSAFSELSCVQLQDQEVQNRTRLIGFGALTGALSSEALYNDTAQFRSQVATIMRPILVTIFQSDPKVLDGQSKRVKDVPISPYLDEFRTRPTIERRAASIHLHVDGDKGPSVSDVSNACLRAYVALLEHSNGSQLGYIMRSSLDNLDMLKGWSNLSHCNWFAQKTANWSQYQYRYAVPTWLVERLLEADDAPVPTLMHQALTSMVTTVFNSPTPLINLSTSDIMANLMTTIIRRTMIDAEDSLLPALVQCISALGRHVYYSDQIQDLAVEAINRITIVEVQGVVIGGITASPQVRTEAIRVLLAGLLGLIHSADVHDESVTDNRKRSGSFSKTSSPSIDAANKDAGGVDERAARRTQVSPDIWHDTLSLLCDKDFAVRTDYAHALSFYIANEMPKHADPHDLALHQKLSLNKNLLLHEGDTTTKFLNALHAYVFILSTTSSLGLSLSSSPSASLSAATNGDAVVATLEGHKPVDLGDNGERLFRPSLANIQAPRGRKVSLAFRLLETTSQTPTSATATLSDFADILDILATVYSHLPVRGLLTGLPMLLLLDSISRNGGDRDLVTIRRQNVIRCVLAKLWMLLGSQWGAPELVDLAEKAMKSVSVKLPQLPNLDVGVYHPPQKPLEFSSTPLTSDETSWEGVDAEAALLILVTNQNIQGATGLDRTGLLKQLSKKWTATDALQDSYNRSASYDNTIRGDGVSPLLKISPALMHIENMSMQSLSRPARAVGVTDLREALEGRSSMSNPALAMRPSSISTLDHGSSFVGDSRLTQTRSRTKKRAISGGPGEVKDVLNRLGIGKHNGSLLKASFPALQRDQR